MTDDVRAYWDEHAAAFDDEPDHGLRDPAVRAAWGEVLGRVLPPAPVDVVDLGCGTGSLSVVLAAAGYRVRGLDLSGRMVATATAKADEAGVDAQFSQGDASAPPYEPASADVVLARHVLWALPDPADALGRWTRLLRPAGRLVLIEGHWSTGAGISAAECRTLVMRHRRYAVVERLEDPLLWGRTIEDERYLLVSLD
jgi:ubiquinone/menaquinone biosynthesis C-methylase UbiE